MIGDKQISPEGITGSNGNNESETRKFGCHQKYALHSGALSFSHFGHQLLQCRHYTPWRIPSAYRGSFLRPLPAARFPQGTTHDRRVRVLVESSDRLARDSVVAELVIRQFQKAGGKVLTASGVDLTEGSEQNPTAKFIRQILAAVAEMDRSLICLKLKAARERKGKARLRPVGRLGYGQRGQQGRRIPGRRQTGGANPSTPRRKKQSGSDCRLAIFRGIPRPQGNKIIARPSGRILRRRNGPAKADNFPDSTNFLKTEESQLPFSAVGVLVSFPAESDTGRTQT